MRRVSLLVALVILVIDQLTKWWSLERLDDGRVIDVIWTLRFRLVFNEGMSFSLGQGLGWLVGVIGIGVVIVLLVWAGRLESTGQRIAVGAVLGGAIGNLVDRIFRADDGPLSGAVVDFVDLQWWPVFNVADMALVIGVISLVLLLAREDHLEQRQQPTTSADVHDLGDDPANRDERPDEPDETRPGGHVREPARDEPTGRSEPAGRDEAAHEEHEASG